MNYLFTVAVILFTSIILLLINRTNKIIVAHNHSIKLLQEAMVSLQEKQQLLNNKITIAKKYDDNYINNIKILGNEVVELQQFFIELIQNR